MYDQPFVCNMKFHLVPDKRQVRIFNFCFVSCKRSLCLHLRATVTEGLFVGTASSVVNFVEQFNRFYKCTSNDGTCKGSNFWSLLSVCLFVFLNSYYKTIVTNQSCATGRSCNFSCITFLCHRT